MLAKAFFLQPPNRPLYIHRKQKKCAPIFWFREISSFFSSSAAQNMGFGRNTPALTGRVLAAGESSRPWGDTLPFAIS
jgi:hypothetical protein